MKKFVVLFVILSVMFLGTVSAKNVEITFWTLFSGGEGHIMTQFVEDFNAAHPEITVKAQKIDWLEYYNKLLTGLISGQPPDVAIMHLSVLPDYASKGVLTPVKDYVPKVFLDEYLPNIIERAHYNGELVALPLDTHPLVFYYNKKVLESAGLVDADGNPKVPQTWDEYIAWGQEAQSATGDYGASIDKFAMLGERWFIALYNQLGGSFYSEKAGKVIIDPDLAEEVYGIINASFANEMTPVTDYDGGEALFINDKAAYHLNGVWAMAVYPDTEGLDFGVTQVPAIEGSKPYTWGDSHSIIFPKSPKQSKEKLEAAVTFAKWIVEHSYEWANAGHLPVIKKILESEEFLALPMREDYLDAAANAVLAPSVIGWSEFREEMWEICQKLVIGEFTEEEAAQELVNKANSILQ